MAMDAFLMIDGITAETKDDKKAKELQIESYSFGVHSLSTPAIGGGLSAGKAEFDSLNVSAHASVASPTLFLFSAKGTHIPKVVLTCRKQSGDDAPFTFLEVTMKECFIGHYSIGGGEEPMEGYSINFTAIDFKYAAQAQTGGEDSSVTHGWDLKKNTKNS